MIELEFHSGMVYVYNVDDWSALRKYRIVGELIGSTNYIPALPARILPEEVILLLDKGIIKVTERQLSSFQHDKGKYDTFKTELYEKHLQIYKNNRQRQLETMIDKIVLAKRQKGDSRPSEQILNEEVEKSSTIAIENMIWPTFMTPLSKSEECRHVSREEIINSTTKLKCATFQDLWERGYYITMGDKFGGDFIVYKGDPIIFHAIFIIRCIEDHNSLIHSSEIVAFGRMGTSVRKRAVLATFIDNKISYITVNWIDA